MDREVHRRFLEYRETFPYFHSAADPMLTREEFEELDALRRELESVPAEQLDDESKKQLAMVRKLLLRD